LNYPTFHIQKQISIDEIQEFSKAVEF